jgi:hypothetical protein
MTRTTGKGSLGLLATAVVHSGGQPSEMVSAMIGNWLTAVHDVVQTVFFLTVGIVTILTYLKAKKTLLQPLRTEIFKEQIKVFAEILAVFSGKGETQLRDDFAFDQFFHANAMHLLDEYAKHFFDVEIDADKRPYNTTDCPQAILTHDTLVLADEHTWPEPPAPSNPADLRTRAASWSQFKFSTVSLPHETVNARDNLERLSRSPLVPKALSEHLVAFDKRLEMNFIALRELFTEAARELPEKYPTLQALEKASLMWLHNRYNQEFQPLEPPAVVISDYLREYFTTDELLKS